MCLGPALSDPYNWYRRAKIDFLPFYIGLNASRANFGRAYVIWFKSKAFWDVGNRIYEMNRVFEFNLTEDAALPIYGNK